MKKFLTTMTLGTALLAGSSFASAEETAWMTQVDVSLGGMQPRMSLDYVREIYGPMKETTTHYDKHAVGYGDTVKIIPTADGRGVKSILVEANNGWATPAGITVGMSIDEVKKIYGSGEVNPVRHKSHHMPGFDYYTYFPSSDHMLYLTFAAKDGKVAYIKAGTMER